jgi:DNA-binding helix-hairpin-helix protein with protein kinase domain
MNVTLKSTKRLFPLGNRIGGGAEGDVYLTPYPSRLVKIWRKPTTPVIDKLEAMVATPITTATGIQIAWPSDLVLDVQTQQCVGYMMPRIQGISLHLWLDELAMVEQRTPLLPVQVAEKLCQAVQTVHKHSCLIGDFNSDNIIIDPQTGNVGFIDTDAWAVQTKVKYFPWNKTNKPGFVAPELLANNAPVQLKATHDEHALAVHVFQLVMIGTHPFVGIQKSLPVKSRNERVKLGWFPYSPHQAQQIKPHPQAADFQQLPQPIRELFLDAFAGVYIDPSLRPTSGDWLKALTQILQDGSWFTTVRKRTSTTKQLQLTQAKVAASAVPQSWWQQSSRMFIGSAVMLVLIGCVVIAATQFRPNDNHDQVQSTPVSTTPALWKKLAK